MILESIGYFRLGAAAVIMIVWTGIVWFTATRYERDRVAEKLDERAWDRRLH